MINEEIVKKEDFKVGDKVECIDNGSPANNLTKGKIYEVKEVDNPYHFEKFIKIINDKGKLHLSYKRRFKLVGQGKIFIFRK